MKKQILVLGLLIGLISVHKSSVAQEAYPSLGYFPDSKVAIKYEVQAGESLIGIAKKFRVSKNAIKKANLKLSMRDQLKLGEFISVYPPKVQGLKAPRGSVKYTKSTQNLVQKAGNNGSKKVFYIEYKIQQGDTLYGISKKFKTSIEYIRRANLTLSMSDHIEPKQIIKIPIVK